MSSFQTYLHSGFSALQVFRRALKLVWKSNPVWTGISIALNFFQASLPLAIFYLTSLIIDQLVHAFRAGELESGRLGFFLLGLGGLWFINGLMGIATNWLQELQQLQFNDYIAGVIQEQSIRLDMAFYENPELQDTFYKTQYEAAYRPWQLLQSVHQLLQSSFYLGMVMVFLFALAWWLIPVLVLAGLPGLLVRMYYSRRHFALDRQRAHRERESWFLHDLLTQASAARELRLYRAGVHFRQRYRALREQLFKDKRTLLSRQVIFDAFSQLSEVLALTGLVAWIAFRTLSGALSVGALVMYLQAFQRGMTQLRSALGALAALHGHRLFLTYLFDFLDLKPRVQDPTSPKPLPGVIAEGFRVENLTFTYPNQHQPILKDLNLGLKRGARIAIVGPNGSGKSTLVKLLARYYDPDKGRILLDGVDLRECAQDDLRSKMSIVFQDFYRYPFTALENISISDLHRDADLRQVQEAARASGAASAIDGLPRHYDTLLGNTFYGGVELSGGQWQQVAIARAFYADKDVLILDEPMSAIDPLVEQQIFEEIFNLEASKTVIFITHRLYHLMQADHIIVLDQGQMAEAGTFEELMAAKGLFYRLFSRQQVGGGEGVDG